MKGSFQSLRFRPILVVILPRSVITDCASISLDMISVLKTPKSPWREETVSDFSGVYNRATEVLERLSDRAHGPTMRVKRVAAEEGREGEFTKSSADDRFPPKREIRDIIIR